MSTTPLPIREYLSRKRTDVRKSKAVITQAFYDHRGWVSVNYPVTIAWVDWLNRNGASRVAVAYTCPGEARVVIADFTTDECA
jgi:hypothetical protein